MSNIKVLVCGSYQGAFQVKLCQRLKKEKQEVFVLSNDSVKERKTSAVFQDYRFPYDSESVMNVISSISPDVVIFCGALDATYDWKKGVSKSVEYVAGTMNTMTCAAEANVKKFIYLSSLDVFAGNTEKEIGEEEIPIPTTQRGKSILQGEKICLAASDKNEDTKIAVVRMPQVYGVCDKKAESSICNELANAISGGSKWELNRSETYHLMYLDDAVDAVYKILMQEQEDVTKVYPVVHQAAVKQDFILEAFENLMDGNGEIPLKKKVENVRFSSASQQELGFTEKYSLVEGLALFFKQYIELPQKAEVKESKKQQVKEQTKLFRPILETILAFVLVQLFITFTGSAAFHNVIDVYLIYVLVIAVVLGAVPSVLAVVLSILGKYYMLFATNLTLSVFTDYTNYLWILQIFSLAVLTGYLKDWYARNVGEMKRENDYLKKEIESIKSINDSNVEVKDVFEKRLVNYKDSYAKVYDIISQLDDLESKSILFKAARVVADVMESKDVAVYTYEAKSGFCRLMASTSEFARKKGKSFRLSDYAEVLEKLNDKQIYMNRKFEENMPMFAAGTYNGDTLEVVIMVWSMDLVNVSLHQSNMLTMLTKLMERSTTRALRYMESVKNSTYIADTKVMEAKAFEDMLDIYCSGESEGVLEYTLLKVDSYEEEKEKLYEDLSHMTRGTDYLGIDSEGQVYILLTNSNEEDSSWVMKRCSEHNIKTQIVKKNKGKTAEEVFSDSRF